MTVEIIHMSYKIVMQVQIDVLSVVSNVQQVPPEELIASQEKTESSTRFAFTIAIYVCLCRYQCRHIYTYAAVTDSLQFYVYIVHIQKLDSVWPN